MDANSGSRPLASEISTIKRRVAIPSRLVDVAAERILPPGIANGNGDILEQAHAVQALDHDLDLEEGVGSAVPLHFDHALGMLHKTLDVGAVGAMHRNATTARDETDDVVARHRIAAMRQTDQQAAVALCP